jgi:alginate O-acetyltransferase complex protein AlgI
MLFNSFIFFMFLALVFGTYLILRNGRARAVLLLLASYVFYGYWDWRFTILLAISTLTDFSVGLALEKAEDRKRRKRWLLVSCLVNLGILGVFKYFNFFLDSARSLVGAIGFAPSSLHLRLILPVGISFYTFKTLSYSIDVYRRKIKPAHSLIDYGLFVAFFPNLVAGPIERAGHLLPQLGNLKAPSGRHLREGLVLITQGLFKKVLIGDAAARIVNNIFGRPDLYRSPELLAALVLFSIQVYADFAGYSDIACGVARLFGVELVKNFNQPYLSRSFSEFWRRWHISLSTWIWDYIFNPLMSAVLRRISKWHLKDVRLEMRVAYPVSAVATMLLCGLWHGAGITFLIWGGLHGLFLSFERLFVYRSKAIPMRPRIRGMPGALAAAVKWGSTQLLVIFAWLFFRSKDLGQVGYFLTHIFRWQSSELAGHFLMIVLAFGAMVLAADLTEYLTGNELWLLKLRPAMTAGICAAVWLVVGLYLMTNQPMPFLYFQF